MQCLGHQCRVRHAGDFPVLRSFSVEGSLWRRGVCLPLSGIYFVSLRPASAQGLIETGELPAQAVPFGSGEKDFPVEYHYPFVTIKGTNSIELTVGRRPCGRGALGSGLVVDGTFRSMGSIAL